MTITVSTATEKVRKAIDDIAPSVTDSFKSDVDAEIAQALLHATEQLSVELPLSMLKPSKATIGNGDGEWRNTDNSSTNGSGAITLGDTFLRFAGMLGSGWNGMLYELMEPASDEEKRQRSTWSRGSKSKPKATLESDASGNKVLRYWPYTATIIQLNYIQRPTESSGSITCDLKSECEKYVIYRAAAIFLEGKKESDTAAKFFALSNP